MREKIFLIHGLLDTSAKLSGVRKFLEEKGYQSIYDIQYPSYEFNIDKIARSVFLDIVSNMNDFDEPINLICHSMGGIIATKLCDFGLNINLGFLITSPLQGVPLVRRLCGSLGKNIISYLIGLSGSELGTINTQHISFTYYTISTNIPYLENDGIVGCTSMKVRPNHNFHIPNSTHDWIMFDERLHIFIDEKLKEHNGIELKPLNIIKKKIDISKPSHKIILPEDTNGILL